MSGHDEVERALRADAASLTSPGASLDVAAAARGARARRMPVQIAVGTASVLALIGFGGIAFASLPQLGGQVSSSDSAAESPEIGPLATPDGTPTNEELGGMDGGAAVDTEGGASPGSDGETAWSLFACGESLPPVGHGADLGLALEVLPVDAADARDGRLPVTVTLTNTTDAPITGNSAILPHLALALENDVVWHTAGVLELVAVVVDLAPGESQRYETHLDLLVCDGSAGDEPFPLDLPSAPAGNYEVVAALDLITTYGEPDVATESVVVISPRASLTIP